MIGRARRAARRSPPTSLGDYAGGSLYLVVGVLAALHHARATGTGQVVDAAIVDGTAHLTAMIHGMLAAGGWQDRRGANLLDGGCPFYGTYETADGGYMAVGALETALLRRVRRGSSASTDCVPAREDLARWGELRDGRRRPLQDPHPRRVDGRLRGLRRLRGARPVPARGARPPAPRRPRHLRRPRRHHPARPRAALLRHPRSRARDRPPGPAPTPRRSPATGTCPALARAGRPGRGRRPRHGRARRDGPAPATAGCGPGRPGPPSRHSSLRGGSPV